MAFESFYGGRQGASFVIVKRFDGINIPQSEENPVYTRTAYAIDENQNFIITTDSEIGNVEIPNAEGSYLISKTSDNYTKYDWKLHDNDGTEALDGYLFPTKRAEGMIQHFSEGANTLSEVNYGEYVIIDSVGYMGAKSNPDNGKVFRRGLDINNEYRGGEYIGQIVGPQGETPDIDFTTYVELNKVKEDGTPFYTHQNKEYNPTNGGIVPGYEKITNSNGSFYENFNDEIKYAYTTIKDAYGNIEGCLIGLQIPTLVQSIEAYSISPYGIINGQTNLAVEDSEEYQEGSWKHPFFQKWKINIPHGIHGIDSTNVEVVSTYTMPYGYKENFEGAKVFTNIECTIPYENTPVLESSYELMRIGEDNHIVCYNDSENNKVYEILLPGNQTVYVKAEDCYRDILRYKETSFEESEDGESTYIELGEYNNIQRVTLADDGTLMVFYSAKAEPQLLGHLRWIKDVEIEDDGTTTIVYNLLSKNGDYEKKVYNNLFKWLSKASLKNGKLYFLNNVNELVSSFDIKYPISAKINNKKDESSFEGSGDQKIHLTYSTGEQEAIGAPINYIVETCISKPTIDFPNAPYNHLLIYFSDPELRKLYKDKYVKYPSVKLYTENEQGEKEFAVLSEWVDMGSVKGEPGGLHIIGNFSSYAAIADKAPEVLAEELGLSINDAAGWAVTIESDNGYDIYCYDYTTNNWYSIGAINAATVDPSFSIVKSFAKEGTVEPQDGTANSLNVKGFWLATEKAYCAQ